ncbi:hypothetical protein V8C37DRAFT_199138 [Trichoderma ceciliae]
MLGTCGVYSLGFLLVRVTAFLCSYLGTRIRVPSVDLPSTQHALVPTYAAPFSFALLHRPRPFRLVRIFVRSPLQSAPTPNPPLHGNGATQETQDETEAAKGGGGEDEPKARILGGKALKKSSLEEASENW